MAGRLYLVATPIGNLEDLGHRALRVLREVDLVACEDTRTSRVLLDRYGVGTPCASLHAHSDEGELEALLARLDAGASIAVVSDAGTPLLSDPGGELVRRAIERGVEVVPVPGPSALLAALAGAGVPADRFVFLGFLPREEAAQRELLAPLSSLPWAVVIYEAPSRVGATLSLCARVLGDRPACVARELTKRFETFDRGALSALAERYADGARGEVVLVIGGAEPGGDEAHAGDVDADIRRLLAAGTAASELARMIAGAHGLSKKEAYRRVLALKGSAGEG